MFVLGAAILCLSGRFTPWENAVRVGQSFLFRCDDCGYEADVCGGPDAGMTVSVRTMACRSCLELVDVVTQVHSVAGRDAPMRLHVCPVCDSVDLAPWGQVESYEDPEGGFTRRKEPEPGESWGECPKCAGPMRATSGITLWD